MPACGIDGDNIEAEMKNALNNLHQEKCGCTVPAKQGSGESAPGTAAMTGGGDSSGDSSDGDPNYVPPEGTATGRRTAVAPVIAAEADPNDDAAEFFEPRIDFHIADLAHLLFVIEQECFEADADFRSKGFVDPVLDKNGTRRKFGGARSTDSLIGLAHLPLLLIVLKQLFPDAVLIINGYLMLGRSLALVAYDPRAVSHRTTGALMGSLSTHIKQGERFDASKISEGFWRPSMRPRRYDCLCHGCHCFCWATGEWTNYYADGHAFLHHSQWLSDSFIQKQRWRTRYNR